MAIKSNTTKTIIIVSASVVALSTIGFLIYSLNKAKKSNKKEMEDLKSQLSEYQKKEQVSNTIKEVKANPIFIKPIKVM